ncbi:hypothetical protein SAMN04487996_1115 [Dyadobacter soli]|uniref:Outer membrane protein beta-barrel domain-containing protein n=1 Tax=Dyadobacter soli TaxID=659014 RepID=A0A1G7LJB8_9BACT|nr:hypothetical protein [Dyadobacter soli]SDF49598.1 hypothetical protein SAMN04487996_1115 [Dyadobacter soli]
MPRNKPALILCFLLLSICAKAQIRFEKGYFISNDQVKTVCNIRNVDWDNNPSSFRYRLPGSDEVLEAALQDVSAFGIDGGNSYVRALVKVDDSSTDVNRLSNGRNPDWKEELVFLKVLVKGEATLLQYKRGEVTQFYYQKSDSLYTPLVFRRYIDGNGQTATNFGFRQQLLNDLACQGISQQDIERTNYRESDLTRFFEKFNSCKNPAAPNTRSGSRDQFNLKITPGANLTMLTTSRFTTLQNDKRKGNYLFFRGGVEAEYIASFHRNKWSVFTEPAFQYHKMPLKVTGLDVDVNFWTIEVPVGVRHYFFLSDRTKIFVNALFGWTVTEKQFGKDADERKMEVISGSGFAAGAGIATGRFSAEARYYINRDIYSSYIRVDADFTKLSLILGYKLFEK